MLLYSVKAEDLFALTLSLSLALLIYYDYRHAARASTLADGLLVHRRVPKVVSELEEFGVDVVIENRSQGDIPFIIIEDRVPEYLEVSRKPAASMILPRGEVAGFSYKVRPLLPGSHVLYSLTLRVGGPLGFFVVEKEVQAPSSFVVLPHYGRASLGLRSVERFWGLLVRGRSTGGMYDVADYREYVPGDDHRRIVWKAFARTGRLFVREDYGEVISRVLVMLDLRAWDWRMGVKPNTLASLELRFLRSLVQELARYRVPADVAVCCGAVAKVVSNATEDVERSLLDLFSYLTPFCSCSSPLTVFLGALSYIGRSARDYAAALLVSNPVSLASENPVRFLELVKAFEGKLRVLIPRFEYELYVNKEELDTFYKALARLVEGLGGTVELIEESFSIKGPGVLGAGGR